MTHPARPATTPPTLPEWDPAWSRIVTAPTADGPHDFHVLDTLAALRAEGIEPQGTILALHGNPTWSYLWRRLAAATVESARAGARAWRLIAPDQLDMGYSERLPHDGLPTPRGPEVRRISERIADFDAVVTQLLAEAATGSEGDAGSAPAESGTGHPVVTIGHDWGGVLSLGWAARNRDRVDAAISLNTAVHQPEDAPIPAPLRATLAGPMLPTATVLTDGFLRVTLRLGEVSPEVRAAFRAPYETAALRHGIGGFVADIPVDDAHPSYDELQRIGADIAAFDRPALLVWGPKDPVFLERYLRDLRGRLPHADVHRFELGSHLVSEDFDVPGTVLEWLGAQFPTTSAAVDNGASAAPGTTASATVSAPRTTVSASSGTARQVTAILDARRDDEAIASVDFSKDPAQQITWRHLWHVTTAIAHGLRDLGVQPGDRVSMLVPPGNNLTAALYACLKIGAVAVVADAGLGPQGMTRAVTSADPQWIIGELPGLGLARTFGWPGRRISVSPLGSVQRRIFGTETSLTELARTPIFGDLPTPGPDADAAILFTSGSTGPAKGVRYTHGDIAALAEVLTRVFDVREGTGLVAGFPPFALLGPAIGATSVTPDMSVTKPKTLTATAIADAIIAGHATMVFASPAAYRNVAATAGDLDDAQRAACAGVELVLSAGAPVPLELMESIAEVFPNASIHSPYGMTEGLLLTDIDAAGVAAAEAGSDLGVCVGTPIDGVELALAPIDATGTAADDLLTGTAAQGRLGEFVVSAAHLRSGYDNLWRTTAQAGRDRLGGRDWHRTNDIGHIDDEGRVWLEGRLQHVVTTPRGPVGPGGLEALIDTDDEVTRSAVVGVGPTGTQALVAVLDAEGTGLRPGLATLELTTRLRELVAGTGADLAAVLVAPTFPTDIRHNSKIDRSRLAAWADRVLAGEGVPRRV